jgi:hypothetical protein
MPGLSDKSAAVLLNGLSSQPAAAWPASMFLALFTGTGKDDGTGFTEVSAAGYARVQISGSLSISAGQGAPGTTLTFSSVPAWVQPGMSITDTTHAYIPANTTVVSTTPTTIVISASSTVAVATSDNIVLSAFTPPTTGEPSVLTNGSVVSFPQSGASWGNVLALGIYDASSAGNLWAWDYLGNYPWLPLYVTSANPAVWTVKGHNYFAGDSVVYSNEYGGTLMTMSAGSFSLTGDGGVTGVSPILTINASPATDTFNASNGVTTIATSTSGSGSVRKLIQQAVPINAVVSFTASTLTLLAA